MNRARPHAGDPRDPSDSGLLRRAASVPERSWARHWLERGVALLLVVAFATGGGAHDSGPGDAIARLVALPVLVAAILVFAGRQKTPLHWLAIGTATLVAALPALQLLPVPASLWAAPPGRAALLRDLQAAGVVPRFTWTLTPGATERALWSQLPALAAFFGALAVDSDARRRLATVLVVLVTAGLLLGVLQMAAGQDSILNPFPEWVPVVGGVFANPNHQASALVIGAVLALAAWLEARKNPRRGQAWRQWLPAAGSGLCLIALPATGSRAAMLLAGPAIVALFWASGAFARGKAASPGLRRVVIGVGAVTLLTCTGVAWYLLQSTTKTEARWPMASATAALAREAWPLGTGVGSFRPWFEQSGPDSLLSLEYINHAHNEYVQWWLEGGLAATVLIAAVLATLVMVVRVLLKRRVSPASHAAWIGVGVLLASSLVDYPLRTPALMTIGAFLAGMAVARAARPSARARAA